MRPATQVYKPAFLIETYDVILDLPDDFDLVVFTHVLKELYGLVFGNDLSDKLVIAFYYLTHLFFYLDEVFRRKWVFYVKVVVEAIFGGGSDGNLCLRKQLLDGMGHYV
ncbi:hypothetical protein MBAV_002462 [Candidatus Magnetobacterium bavaricum]|uniref:Uncharacterized protein n=1 Tax=Candidatus Magnetobacterium bavaricum TaxID=29290 RepID=A0A0F3GTQ7_9BACT|nr:hypothetical protein MBAV_002462 [Candidatus Magnetobacterium bavaricum]